MATVNETKWLAKYQQLKDYVEQYHQLPDKKKVENRGLLNWWKYNKKLAKLDKLSEEKLQMLQELSDSRIIKSDKRHCFCKYYVHNVMCLSYICIYFRLFYVNLLTANICFL